MPMSPDQLDVLSCSLDIAIYNFNITIRHITDSITNLVNTDTNTRLDLLEHVNVEQLFALSHKFKTLVDRVLFSSVCLYILKDRSDVTYNKVVSSLESIDYEVYNKLEDIQHVEKLSKYFAKSADEFTPLLNRLNDLAFSMDNKPALGHMVVAVEGFVRAYHTLNTSMNDYVVGSLSSLVEHLLSLIPNYSSVLQDPDKCAKFLFAL